MGRICGGTSRDRDYPRAITRDNGGVGDHDGYGGQMTEKYESPRVNSRSIDVVAPETDQGNSGMHKSYCGCKSSFTFIISFTFI